MRIRDIYLEYISEKDEKTIVSAVKSIIAMQMINNEDLKDIAVEIKVKI